MPSPILSLQAIHKHFGPVQALKGVSLEIYPGEIHALIGENGAGKSTLMKILSGVYQPDAGQMLLDGNTYAPANPLDARNAGISMIYQELTLAQHLTVEENITLGLENTRNGFIQSRSKEVASLLDELGQSWIYPKEKIANLSIGKRQMVEIARALFMQARIVVMDEPTSSLSADDTQALFKVIENMRARGLAIIYISHFLEEIESLCDRYTVLRDGESVASGKLSETNISTLVSHMVGRNVDELYPHIPHELGEVVLDVQQLSNSKRLPVSAGFTLRKGEILGIAGLIGSGRSEMLRTIFGLEKGEKGTITTPGGDRLAVAILTPEKVLSLGIDLLSEDRKEEGLALNLSILHNITLSNLQPYVSSFLIRKETETQEALSLSNKLALKASSLSAPASSLSGGNQQKICLARLLHHNSDILFLDEPTRGIDIGSKAEIYRLIQQLAAQGKSIVMVSSYLPELLGVCDTLAVMHRGSLSPKKPVSAWTEHGIMYYATSGAG